MAGPLGEMFDHGCDALNTTVRTCFRYLVILLISHCCSSQLAVILCARALNLGRSWWTVASQIATLANFYLTTWEEYHTVMAPVSTSSSCVLTISAGQLFLGIFSGHVEGILSIVLVYVITGFTGKLCRLR